MAKKGYPVKAVRLWSGPAGTKPTPDEMIVLQRECYRLQGEMKEWGKNPNQRKSAKWRSVGAIYFVQSGDHVKIGFATNLNQRISQLRVSTPQPLELLGTIPGNRYIEQFLHWQFREAKESGEWFRLTDALRAFIAENVASTKGTPE